MAKTRGARSEVVIAGLPREVGGRQLLRRGRVDLALVYGLALLSETGREALRKGGTYRFCELINRNRPQGRFLIGRLVDKSFLGGPAAVGMRNRFALSKRLLQEELRQRLATQERVRLLSLPIGGGRDLYEALIELERELPELARRVEVVGMDLDSAALEAARGTFEGPPRFPIALRQGNALVAGELPAGQFDVVFSMGFSCYLGGEELRTVYGHLARLLAPDGVLLLNSVNVLPFMARYFNQLSRDSLVYRSPERLRELLATLPLKELELQPEPSGAELIVRARAGLS
jgi:SAM-dependent methyltransferase